MSTEKESTEYTLSLEDLALAIMKDKGISEGKWAFDAKFVYAAVYAGPSDAEICPAGLIGFDGVKLKQLKEGAKVPQAIVFDAKRLLAGRDSASGDTTEAQPRKRRPRTKPAS